VAGPITDAELVSRCRSGDQEAWNELVERFSRYVYAICSQGFRLSSHDAEDVFQEVFARVYQRLDRLRSDDAIRPWIAQLTRRLCIDRLRGTGRGPLPGHSRPLFLPRRELQGDRRGARAAGGHDREPNLPLPREAAVRAGGKIVSGWGV
jgi:RNA polymerase sigma-70 factor (ECF subfamily)